MKPFLLFDAEDIKRLISVAFFLFFLFCLIVIRYYYLQIMQGDKWDKIAQGQHQLELTEYFMRGGFYSNTDIKLDQPNKKIPFVVEIPKFHLYIDPDSIDAKYRIPISKKLFSFFNFSLKEKEKIFSEFFKKSRSRKIITWIDRTTKEDILTWWTKFSKDKKIAKNAIFFVNDYKRSYPFGPLLGQVLHTVQDQKDPYTFQAVPTGGLELYFNDYLKGRLGKRIITRSLRHSLDTGDIIDEPENGCDIYLTINHYLQAISEEELEKGVKKVNAKGGWAIMMDPNTGEILAFAQAPAFDVTNYKNYYNDEKLQDLTKLKALVDPYEPGSIMKPITLAICLKANEELAKQHKPLLFRTDEKIPTSNGHFPGRSKPIKDVRTHNFLNTNLAIQKSSNVYFATLVDRLINRFSEKWYREALVDLFGFSKKTDIELPGEADGLVPTIGKLHKNNTLEWSRATPYSLAMGYNILVNSLQMLRAYSIIANGGLEVKPTLLKKIVKHIDGGEQVIVDNSANYRYKNRRQILSKESCKFIKTAMKYSTKPGGTAPLADIPGYTEAGKTGTAEKNINGEYKKDIHISSFVGMVPATEPRFVLMVVIDEPEAKYVPGVGKQHAGGACAAPIFKEIATTALKYLGVAPDDPFGYPYPDPRRNTEKADFAKELKNLAETYKSWNH